MEKQGYMYRSWWGIVALLGAAMPIMMYGCKDGPTNGGGTKNKAPTVTEFTMTPENGTTPLQTTSTIKGSDSDGNIETYHLDADNDGQADKSQSTPTIEWTYQEPGTKNPHAWVTDNEGANSPKKSLQITVQTNKPIFTTDGQDFNQVEQQEKAYALEDLVQNGNITNATITTGPANTQINGDSLRITTQDMSEASQNYSLELTAENQNGTSTENINATIQGKTDIRGQTQQNKTNTGHKGHIYITDTQDNQITDTTTDNNGNIQLQLEELVENITITSYLLNQNNEQTEYGVETQVNIPNPGEDIDLRNIRVIDTHRLQQNGIDPSIFRNDVLEVLDDKVKRWEDSNIYITQTSPLKENGTPTGKFTTQEQQDIAQIAQNPDQLGKMTEYVNRNIVIGSVEDENPPYTQNQDGSINIDEGWVIVTADTTIAYEGLGGSGDTDKDGLYDKGIVSINSPKAKNINAWEAVILHELAHAYGHEGHTTHYTRDESIMAESSLKDQPATAYTIDEERSLIINEETYTNKPTEHILKQTTNQ